MMDSDFPQNMWGWVGTGCGGIPPHLAVQHPSRDVGTLLWG